MKICHVILSIARGGAENHLIELITNQINDGFDVNVIYLKNLGESYWLEYLQRLGVSVHSLFMQNYGEFWLSFKLSHLIRDINPDLVHAHLPAAELYTRLALISLDSIPFVISKHNDAPFIRYKLPFVLELERWVARRASKIICISQAVSTFFSKRWDEDLCGRIEVIYYGINVNKFRNSDLSKSARLREIWGCGQSDLVVGTIARLTDQKNLHILIKAFAIVRSYPRKINKLIIVGEGELEHDLKKLVTSLGLVEHVRFLGKRSDVIELHKAFDIFALSSKHEGFGLVLLEAMAASRPIVATAVSAIPEVVTGGVGILVPPFDAQAMAAALLEFEDDNKRQLFGSNAFNRAHNAFSNKSMHENTKHLYLSLVKL